MSIASGKPFQFGIKAVLLWTVAVAVMLGLPLYHPILCAVVICAICCSISVWDYLATERII